MRNRWALNYWHLSIWLSGTSKPMRTPCTSARSPSSPSAPAPAPGVTADAVVELLGARAAAIPRLRMRVRDVLLPVGGAAWSADKDFDVFRHVQRVLLPRDDESPDGGFMAGATRLAA